MEYKKLAIILFASCFISFLATSQNEQSAYLAAKQHYNVGSYKLAMEGFKNLSNPTSSHQFVEYAFFYYGLAAYKNGDLGLARSVWLQIESKYPKWNKLNEVNFWLANVYFEEGNYRKGIYYAKKSSYKGEQELIKNYIKEVGSIVELKSLNKEYPDNKVIAIQYARAIVRQQLSNRDFDKLEYLAKKFGLNQSEYGVPDVGKSVFKDTYNVAVMLPFMFSSVEDINRISRNKFVMDLYEGILMAQDTLNSQSRTINIYPYDTQRDIQVTDSILRRDELRNMDLIIGPLFPNPSKLVSDFCFLNKINMVNPVSSNDMVINNNPYSFLFKPSNKTIAEKMAEYTISTIDNKVAYVFYDETEKDSLIAYRYMELIEKNNFEIVQCLQVDVDKIGYAHELLTELYEVELNQKELDSLLEIDENLVKERKVEIEGEEEDSVVYYQEFFTIAPDSIGHVFVASSKPLHASSLVSAIEIRPDTIPIITNGAWMNYDMLTIDQLQRLNVKFADPDFINFEKESVVNFRKKIGRKYKKEASLNNYIGYEMMFYLGQTMKRHGTYFQKKGIESGISEGQIFEGLDFNIFNSNQIVPIVTFKNDELINLKGKE